MEFCEKNTLDQAPDREIRKGKEEGAMRPGGAEGGSDGIGDGGQAGEAG